MKKQKAIVVPLYLGGYFHKENWVENVNTVVTYIKRALLFLGTRNNITIFYPKDKAGAAHAYVHNLQVDNILINMKEVKMEKYTYADDIESHRGNPALLIHQFAEILSQPEAKDASYVIYFISMCHVYHFLTAYKKIIGCVDLDFSKPGEIGNTEVFYFTNDEPGSVEHLCYHKHLDFFIPDNVTNLSESIMKLGAAVHAMRKRTGHTKFLEQLATFY